jgi:hypothetical protein
MSHTVAVSVLANNISFAVCYCCSGRGLQTSGMFVGTSRARPGQAGSDQQEARDASAYTHIYTRCVEALQFIPGSSSSYTHIRRRLALWELWWRSSSSCSEVCCSATCTHAL